MILMKNVCKMNYKATNTLLLLTIHFLILSISMDKSSSRAEVHKDEYMLEVDAQDGDLCHDIIKYKNAVNMPKIHPICSNMVPRNGRFQAEPTSTSPWKIYTWKPKILQYTTHPVVLGSDDGQQNFVNYIVAAKAVEGGHFVGHFEYQWDAIPICCYIPGKNYSYEGPRHQPNVLVGAQGVRVQLPNQTVLWTAPKHFEGPIVFVATFWKSGKLYWPNVTSSPVQVVKRNFTTPIFKD